MRRMVQTSLIAAVLAGATAVQADGPFQYYSVMPCRVIDTRMPGQGPISGGQTKTIRVQGMCGVPVGARAVSVNLVAVAPTGAGFMTLFPSGIPLPAVSTINFVANDIISNGAIVPLADASVGNDLSLFGWVGNGGSSHAIIDVTGYYR